MPELPLEGYVRLPSLLAAVGISKSTVLRKIAKRQFPPPVKLGARLNLWNVADLRAWMAAPDTWRAK